MTRRAEATAPAAARPARPAARTPPPPPPRRRSSANRCLFRPAIGRLDLDPPRTWLLGPRDVQRQHALRQGRVDCLGIEASRYADAPLELPEPALDPADQVAAVLARIGER